METSKVCLSLIEPTIEGNLSQIRKYAHDIDLVELRADYLDRYQMAYMHQFPALVELPVILTLRRKRDGGRFDGSEAERAMLLKHAISGKFALVDLESDFHDAALEKQIRTSGGRIIRSYHDFQGVPADLSARFQALTTHSGELPKLAVMPRSTADLVRLLRLTLENRLQDKIVIGMGEYGFATRILASRLGSWLTFTSAPGTAAAPGHIDPGTLADLYRFKTITERTKLYGIIGNPVMHTSSPLIHNSGYSRLGLDAVYLPFLVDRIEDFIDLAGFLDIRGFSVTVPHKQAIIPFLSEKSQEVEVIGSCNTVVKRGADLCGSNTDAQGFLLPLKQAVQGSLSGLKATVIGAGGTARTVVHTLVREGVEVLIVNRTVERARLLAEAFGCAYAGADAAGIALAGKHSDIIVQTTSAGMAPDTESDPLPGYAFQGHELVYEIIYKPDDTCFLQRALDADCRVIYGIEMLHQQAYAQFFTFTGEKYPVDEAEPEEDS